MDITDEHKDKSDKNKPPILPKPCLTSPSSNGMEQIIPQMIVTLADDIPEEKEDAYQTSTSEVLPSEISSDVFIQKETENVSSTEYVDQKSTSAAPVEEQSIITKNEDETSGLSKAETKSQESIAPTASQRPLRIESEKSASQCTVVESDAAISNDSTIPDSPPVTTTQRPLIFNGPQMQAETPVSPEQETSDTLVKENLTEEESKSIPEPEVDSYSSEQQPFPPHMAGKDNFSYRDLDERDEMIRDGPINKELQPEEKINQSHVKKDSLQNVKKFFGTILPETHSEGISSGDKLSNSDVNCNKQAKAEKHGLKKLFSSSKTDPVAKDKSVCNEDELLSKSKSESKDQAKESKYNIKKMFDSFKPESSDQSVKTGDKKKVEKSQAEKKVEDSKPHHKDSKSGIKKFFDSFKHEEPLTELPIMEGDKNIGMKAPLTIPQREGPLRIPGAAVSEVATKDSNIPQIQTPSTIAECKESEKEKQKDGGVKKFFDSFKHDTTDVVKEIPSEEPLKISSATVAETVTKDSNIPEMQIPATVTEGKESDKGKQKDNLHGVKKFFDSFKQDKSDTSKEIPSEEPLKISGATAAEKVTKDSKISEMQTPSTVTECKESDKGKQKDNLHGVKKFFDSFKQDKSDTSKEIPSEEPLKIPGATAEEKVTKDSKIPEMQITTTVTECKENDKGKQKDNLHGVKKFFDSFKQDKSDMTKEIPSEEPLKIAGATAAEKVTKDTTIPEIQIQTPTTIIECKESDKGKQKDNSHGMKKFFDSFKHDKSDSVKEIPEIIPLKDSRKKNCIKKSHSFKDSLLSSPTKTAGDTEKEHGNLTSVKKFFDSFKQEGAEAPESSKSLKEKKSSELKRSQSCREATETAEGSHGFKSFLDSLTHKKISSHSTHTENSDHIYDVVEKTNIPVVNPPDVRPRLSSMKKVEEKPKEDQGGVKKLLDSFLHKDTPVKPKTIVGPKKVRMSDDVSYEVNDTAGTSKDIGQKETPIKLQNSDSSKPKETAKSNIKTDKKLPANQINGPSSSIDGKSSMFNSISDNFSALKGKMFQPKDEKKCKIPEEEIKIEVYDLQSAAKMERPGDTAGTYRPLKDPYFDSQNLNKELENKHSVTAAVQNTVPAQSPVIQSSPEAVVANKTEKRKVPTSNTSPTQQRSPETLYDTCCFKLAVLFSNKAIELVSDKGRTPPKKPPKPTAEAIARARANVVSQRLREMHNKGQSIGENIPVGYDGIRFADDETESSCDYKDVDNFDYIMDYELINRYKFDNKLDTFSDPSTCSGSYYTADTVTLKDENFSDAPLETISLGSNDDYLFQHLSPSKSTSEGKISSVTSTSKTSLKSKPQQANQTASGQNLNGDLSKTSRSNEAQKVKCSVKTPNKRVPPPLPPKPVITTKRKAPQKDAPGSQKDEKTPVSQCINSLSLSPRSKAKLPKDTTKNRPLVVAGLKETEFVGLQTKLKDNVKQPKDRKFEMVLKNESLKKISTISPGHQPLTSTKSSPGVLDSETSTGSLTKKVTPQRPPLPLTLIRSEEKNAKKLRPAPQIPEKPKRSNIPTPSVGEKRTISPPRPPPPATVKFSSPPPRPPPPVAGLQSPEKSPSPRDLQEQDKFYSLEDIQECSVSHDSTTVTMAAHKDILPSSSEAVSDSILSRDYENSLQLEPEVSINIKTTELEPCDAVHADPASSSDHDLKEQCTLNETNEPKNVYMVSEQVPTEEVIVEHAPKPPPRGRRIRSRTVEVVKAEKESEPALRRSQSLSDIDVQKRTSHLDAPSEKIDLKHLYTSVNKNGKKSTLNQSQSSSLEKLSGRPLPAPPPPPRKFRSLDRKHEKEKKCKTEPSPSVEICKVPEEVTVTDSQIHPPVRKKKCDKQRFHSLGHDHSRNNSEIRSPGEDSKISRSRSVPLRPGRRQKHSNVEYDENANVAFPVEAEVHRSDVILDECGNIIQNPNIPCHDAVDSEKVTPNPRRRKDKNPKGKSHSSWYDESQASGEWEIVDWNPSAETENRSVFYPKSQPTRRRSDPGKGTRRSSKFYVDVQLETSSTPHVDKETSPLPLDCSEKSVQTSLETLSHGMTSRDEEDDDTDDLLDLAQTLQNELKVIINRHKSTSDAANDSSAMNTPVLSGTDSEEKNLGDSLSAKVKHSPSTRSSNSELWPLTSSEESDSELPAQGTVNLTEIAMKRKEKKIFYIAREIMTSEEVFVDALKLLNVDFKAAVEAATHQRGTHVVPDEVLSQILNHLPQLQHLNENLLMELKDRIENWDKMQKIADIIVKMGPFLKLYSWYIHDFEYNVSLLEDSKKKFPLFAQVVKDFESSARCKRLALNHYMLKPIQRIPQYRLLLQEYLHHLPEEHVDYQDTLAALQIVSEVATHANDSMKHGDNAQKLISIQNSIMGHKEIIKPGRLFVREGELMKLSRKGMQPRWFVLFNDILLYLTPVQQGLYRVNHELPLTGMKVAIPIQQDYQNEFSIISVARSFTLAARSPEERQEWIVALTKAIEENASKRSTFTNIRLQQRTHEKASEDDGEFVLGRKAPVWIPDARVTMCQLCTSEFTVTFRRHHCRACGKVVCSICSSNRISLPYLGNRIARVCDDCHCKLGPGSGTCTESAETDSDNQQIAVKPHLRTENRHIKKGKRNLPSVLKEVCANDQGSTISGYLQKKSGKSWKRDWFVVKDKVLYEYRASEDVAALKSLPLLGYQIESFSEAYENVDPSLLFQLTHPGQAPIIFHADTVGSTERWISALKEASVLE